MSNLEIYSDEHWRELISVIITRIGMEPFLAIVCDIVAADPQHRTDIDAATRVLTLSQKESPPCL